MTGVGPRMAEASCRNCGAELAPSGAYCPACGQGVVAGQDRSLRHLLGASLAELTSLDSRLWRSIRLLFRRPGFLSREYREGRRRRYLSPISLFVLGNLLFFIAPPLSDFQLSLTEQYELQPYRSWIVPWVDDYLARTGVSFTELADAYRLRVSEIAKLMVIVHVPLLALGTMFLSADKRFYYADHVVMALHYFAFLLIYLISTAAAFGLAYLLAPESTRILGPYTASIVVLLQFAYVPFMLRTSLEFSWPRALLSTPLFAVMLAAAHMAYRLLQFVVAFVLLSTG